MLSSFLENQEFFRAISMDAFQLKADFLPITILHLLRNETQPLQRQLENLVLK